MEAKETYPEVNIFTDGGAEPNPGKGGFGVIMTYKGHRKEFSQGYVLTTNNRMELMGVIFGLEQLKKPAIVNVYSDPKYVVDGISLGWAEKWKAKNWFRTGSKKAINHDLWEKLLELISKQRSVTFNWIKGHDGHNENERCDQLANIALNGEELVEDLGYLQSEKEASDFGNTPQLKDTKSKQKVLADGDLCRKCDTPVIKKQTKKKNIKPNQAYYFEYYLLCTNCKTMYMVDASKRFDIEQDRGLFS